MKKWHVRLIVFFPFVLLSAMTRNTGIGVIGLISLEFITNLIWREKTIRQGRDRAQREGLPFEEYATEGVHTEVLDFCKKNKDNDFAFRHGMKRFVKYGYVTKEKAYYLEEVFLYTKK